MNVRIAAQTLSSSVAAATDFLQEETDLPEFKGSEPTTEFIKKVDMAFDMMNSRHPFAKGYKAPVILKNMSMWLQQCDKLVTYFLQLQDKDGKYLRVKRCKTAIWGFVFSLKSLAAISQELLIRTHNPLKFVLTYKFSQDHIELLFNKIHRRCGWNNNPNVLQFKYALRWLLLRNSIEPSHTGNCTHFEDVLCESNGLIDFSSKRNQHEDIAEAYDENEDITSCEAMLIQMDDESPNDLLDNILYYISGFLVRSLMKTLKCTKCRSELLLNQDDPHALNTVEYPIHAKFTLCKQKGGLLLPSPAVLKIVKATEVLFKKRVQWQKKGITSEKNINLKIQYAILKQLGPNIFNSSSTHFFEHTIGEECNHLTSLVKLVTQKYLSLRLKTYGKRYTEMVVHQNEPSLRHELTKTILFRNQ